MNCCICELPIIDYGNNPFPLVAADDYDSRCCDECNMQVIRARIAMSKKDQNKPKKDDTLVLFYTKNSTAPTESLRDNGKFLAGIVEDVVQTEKNITYKGSWGNFIVDDETDQFTVI